MEGGDLLRRRQSIDDVHNNPRLDFSSKLQILLLAFVKNDTGVAAFS